MRRSEVAILLTVGCRVAARRAGRASLADVRRLADGGVGREFREHPANPGRPSLRERWRPDGPHAGNCSIPSIIREAGGPELWAPVGLRYHALASLFPGHSLSQPGDGVPAAGAESARYRGVSAQHQSQSAAFVARICWSREIVGVDLFACGPLWPSGFYPFLIRSPASYRSP